MTTFQRVRAVLRALSPARLPLGGARSMASVWFVVALGLGTPLGLFVASDAATAKTPGSTYCFYGKCHRVKTLSEMQRLVGKDVSLHSSHYDSCHRDRYNPCGLTSSGEPFFADRADNAASPIYPDGTKLLVWSAQSKQAAVLRVNNAGPYWGNRKLDVSRALARKLGFEHRGVAKLQVRVLTAPTKSEARYKRNRRYAKVRGPIGKFASLDEAEQGLAVLLAFEAMTTAMIAPAGGGSVAHVAQPFDVAARVTRGKAFAQVRPKFEHWPVVWRQYASLTWPVVGALPARADNAPVQIASGSIQRTAALDWPVVRPPMSGRAVDADKTVQGKTPVVRIALAWPVVTETAKQQSAAGLHVTRLSTARAPTRPSAQPLRRKRQAAIRKARTIRLAALRSKQAVRKKTRKRAAATRKARYAKKRSASQRTRTARAKAAVKLKTKAKSKAAAKRKFKATVKRRVRLAKPAPRRRARPHVATRQILHRALGRGA